MTDKIRPVKLSTIVNVSPQERVKVGILDDSKPLNLVNSKLSIEKVTSSEYEKSVNVKPLNSNTGRDILSGNLDKLPDNLIQIIQNMINNTVSISYDDSKLIHTLNIIGNNIKENEMLIIDTEIT